MQHFDQPINTFKLVLIGDGGVGKTTFVKRHITGEFQKPYIPTQGADVNEITFSTNYGKICFAIWDTAGQEKLGGLRECYYMNANCAIIMFDLTSRITYKNVQKWHSDLIKVAGNIPIALVGNKADVKDRKVKAHQITFHRRHSLQYFDISAKSNYQYEKPFLWLMRQLGDKRDLVLIEEPLLRNPEIIMDQQHIQQLESEIVNAQKMGLESLPDNDEDF